MYREGGEEGGRERERERERANGDKRDTSIPYFLRKMNYALSSLLTEKRGEGLKRQKRNDVAYIYLFIFG